MEGGRGGGGGGGERRGEERGREEREGSLLPLELNWLIDSGFTSCSLKSAPCLVHKPAIQAYCSMIITF